MFLVIHQATTNTGPLVETLNISEVILQQLRFVSIKQQQHPTYFFLILPASQLKRTHYRVKLDEN